MQQPSSGNVADIIFGRRRANKDKKYKTKQEETKKKGFLQIH